MIEYRADGSLPGPHKVGRVYKMAGEGKLWYSLWTGELETDLPSYIERYDNFRGFMTGFLPKDEAEGEYLRLQDTKHDPAELEVEKLRHLKKLFLEQHKKAEQAAHAYFVACPVGEERTIAAEIYENVRTAIRT